MSLALKPLDLQTLNSLLHGKAPKKQRKENSLNIGKRFYLLVAHSVIGLNKIRITLGKVHNHKSELYKLLFPNLAQLRNGAVVTFKGPY